MWYVLQRWNQTRTSWEFKSYTQCAFSFSMKLHCRSWCAHLFWCCKIAIIAHVKMHWGEKLNFNRILLSKHTCGDKYLSIWIKIVYLSHCFDHRCFQKNGSMPKMHLIVWRFFILLTRSVWIFFYWDFGTFRLWWIILPSLSCSIALSRSIFQIGTFLKLHYTLISHMHSHKRLLQRLE